MVISCGGRSSAPRRDTFWPRPMRRSGRRRAFEPVARLGLEARLRAVPGLVEARPRPAAQGEEVRAPSGRTAHARSASARPSVGLGAASARRRRRARRGAGAAAPRLPTCARRRRCRRCSCRGGRPRSAARSASSAAAPARRRASGGVSSSAIALKPALGGLGQERQRVAEVADLLLEPGRRRRPSRDRRHSSQAWTADSSGQRGADDDDEDRGVHGRVSPST